MPNTVAITRTANGVSSRVVAIANKPSRLPFIDAVRGLAIVLMALDHVRSFFHSTAPFYEPTDLNYATAPLFMTRWITHLCAPLFVLLAGIGVSLSKERGKSPQELAKFLRLRGAWLILMELTVVKFGWTFNFSYAAFAAQVIWAFGWGMIFLSFLVSQPARRVLGLGIAGLALYGLFSQFPRGLFGAAEPAWAILVSGKTFGDPAVMTFSPKYPVLPWTAMMAVGFGLGPTLLEPRAIRRRQLVWAGAMSLAAFVCLRWIELGGWPTGTGSWEREILLFIDTEKYPPSLTFLLMTSAPALWILAAWDRGATNPDSVLSTFGRVPFFFYIAHIPLIHLMAIVAEHFDRPAQVLLPADTWRYGLPSVYVIWFCTLALLYPACKWFAELKRRRHDAWLSYL